MMSSWGFRGGATRRGGRRRLWASPRGRLPPLGSFLQEHGHVAFVVCVVEGLGVAGAQRGIRVGVVLEEEHPAVQAYHVELVVDVDAVGPEGGPKNTLEPGEYRAEHGVRPPFVRGRPDRGPGFFRRKYRFLLVTENDKELFEDYMNAVFFCLKRGKNGQKD